MEAHVHHNHKGSEKRWKHYFFEFLMLFLAVFSSFLAENQRERIVEHEREKKYMSTLLEDLKIDTADMGKLLKTIQEIIVRKDTFDKYLRPPIAPEMVPRYYKEAVLLLNMRGYSYNDRTVEQLRSSGSYRLIRVKSITDSLIDFDSRMRGTFLRNYNVMYDSRLKLLDLESDILDVNLDFNYSAKDSRDLKIDSLKKHGLWPVHLLTDDKKVLMHYLNTAIVHVGFMMDMRSWIERMTAKAVNLMKMVHKEYGID